jgi:uncharacterized membrane protein YtjA (UPF0391 family)
MDGNRTSEEKKLETWMKVVFIIIIICAVLIFTGLAIAYAGKPEGLLAAIFSLDNHGHHPRVMELEKPVVLGARVHHDISEDRDRCKAVGRVHEDVEAVGCVGEDTVHEESDLNAARNILVAPLSARATRSRGGCPLPPIPLTATIQD